MCISISNRPPIPIMYAKLFRFWQTIEALSPQGADKPDASNKSFPIYRVEDGNLPPWLDSSHLRRSIPANKAWRYSLQCGLFDSLKLAELLTTKISQPDDVLNEKLKGGESRLFDLGFDDSGIPIPETFVLSMACWASGQILQFNVDILEQGGKNNLNDVELYDPPNVLPINSGYKGFDALSKRLIGYVAKQAAVLQDKKATKEWLDHLVRFVANKCYLPEHLFSDQPTYIAKCFQVKVEGKTSAGKPQEGNGQPGDKAGDADESSTAQSDDLIGKPGDKAKDVVGSSAAQRNDLINSFYIGDLTLLKKAAEKKDLGKGLQAFLAPHIDRRTDLRTPEGVNLRTDLRTPEGVRTSLEMLSPERMPRGCWPSDHPLVFSQQLAVNEIWHRLAKEPGLFAVNGPPGTGKTTLLRDIVAAVIVERAAHLVEAVRKNRIFGQEQNQKIGDRLIPYYPFEDAVAGTSIVVVSANNGAVENVSLELPSINSVPNRVEGGYFTELATEVLRAQGQKSARAWGLLAARLGNKQNRTTFLDKFWWAEPCGAETKVGQPWSGEGLRWHLNQIKCRSRQPSMSLEDAIKQFAQAQSNENKARKKLIDAADIPKHIQKKQETYYKALLELQRLADKEAESQHRADEMDKRISRLDKENNKLGKQIRKVEKRLTKHNNEKPGFLTWLLTLGRSHRDWRKRKEMIVAELDNLLKKQDLLMQCKRNAEAILNKALATFAKLARRKASKRAMANNLCEEIGRKLASTKAKLGEHWVDQNCDNDAREKSSPWMTEEWRLAREALFLAALDLHRAFIENNADKMITNLNLVSDWLSGKSLPEPMARTALDTLCLVTPVISTAFASVPRMFADIGREGIGWLLIDEAGQALPQHAAGAIWRAKRTIVVGDPNQLEPVITVPSSVEGALADHYKIEKPWWPTMTSVQRMADQATDIGTSLEDPLGDKLWVGCPLRVHRRCDEPMFSISNHIAYGGMMVFGKPPSSASNLPPSCWIDVHGSRNQRHWIEEEGEVVNGLVCLLLKQFGIEREDIFLVSPFKDCARKLSEIGQQFRLDSKKVGTVHTSQGKEADVVILVLGGDPSRPGAKDWAASKPNLLNVAVSRAKKRLYVIGNAAEWKERRFFKQAVEKLGTKTFQEFVSQVQSGSDKKAP